MTVSEQQQIEDFIDKECQADEHGNFSFNREGLICFLGDFEKQSVWKFDSEAMGKVILDQSIETQAKARLDAFIKHEREQRRFIAANSAMNGLLVNYVANDQYGSHTEYPLVHKIAVRCADALLAELANTNLQTQQP